jgi:hypothetical protein
MGNSSGFRRLTRWSDRSRPAGCHILNRRVARVRAIASPPRPSPRRRQLQPTSGADQGRSAGTGCLEHPRPRGPVRHVDRRRNGMSIGLVRQWRSLIRWIRDRRVRTQHVLETPSMPRRLLDLAVAAALIGVATPAHAQSGQSPPHPTKQMPVAAPWAPGKALSAPQAPSYQGAETPAQPSATPPPPPQNGHGGGGGAIPP